jgi:hypothetical protein
MAYCRNNGNDSDVYIYRNLLGVIACSNCSRMFDKRSAVMQHMDQHKLSGERIPDYAYDRLIEEINLVGDDI